MNMHIDGSRQYPEVPARQCPIRREGGSDMADQPVPDGEVCHPPLRKGHIGEDEIAAPAIHMRKYPFLISNRCSPLDGSWVRGRIFLFEIPMTLQDKEKRNRFLSDIVEYRDY
jgi:hypothetical protein